jgi:hypothetical protein
MIIVSVLAEREGEHIRDGIHPAEFRVELSDFLLRDKAEADLRRLRETLGLESGLTAAPDQ